MSGTQTADPAVGEIKTLQELYGALKTELGQGINKNAERIEQLAKRHDELVLNQEADRKAKAAAHDIGYRETGDPEKDWSWCRFFMGVLDNGFQGHETRNFPEHELSLAAMQVEKAQNAGVDSAGGFLVPTQIFLDQIIPALEPNVVAIAAGATVMDGLVGSPVEFPRIDTLMSGFWTAEGATISETSMELGQMTLTPHGLGSTVELTQRLLRQTSGRVEAAVRDHLVRALARTLDLAIFKGTGGDSQPVGILNQAGVGSQSTSGFTLASGASNEAHVFLEEFIGNLEDANAFKGKPTWFMHPHTRRWWHQFKDADGRPLLFEMMRPTASVQDRTFYGYPYFTSTQLVGNNATADLIMADVEEITIGQWGGLMVEADSSLGFLKGTKWVKATMEVDVGLKHGEAVCETPDLDTTSTP